jgi:hypothetical protein
MYPDGLQDDTYIIEAENDETDYIEVEPGQLSCHRTDPEYTNAGLKEVACCFFRSEVTRLRKYRVGIAKSEDDRHITRQVRLGQARRAGSRRWTNTATIQSSSSH